MIKNNEYLSHLGLTNRKEKGCRENEKKKKVKSKDAMLPFRRSQCLNVVGEKGCCDDVQPDIAHGNVQPYGRHEESPHASDVPQSALVASGSIEEYVSTSIKRKKSSQDLYRATKRHAEERISEGKKPFLVEVSRDGEPIGKNAARWASELGIRCRAHLDICKSNFKEQDPQHVEYVIRNMENAFDTIGGQISRKYYKHKMRLLMNNFRYNCRKTIMEGKERLDSTLSPKQWETLKESMQSEEYLTKSNRGKRARDNVRAGYTFGRGGLQAKMNKFGVKDNNREASAEDIVNYMAAPNPTKFKSSVKFKSSSSTKISEPSVECPVRPTPNHANSNEGYQHIMSCLHILTEKLSELTSSVQLIVSTWNDHNSMNSDQKCIDKFKDGDKVNVLDPFDGDIVGIGRIHSLSIVQGVNLKGTRDANVNILKALSNVPLVYEDKMDGATRMKEKEGTFTRWPLKYLQKIIA